MKIEMINEHQIRCTLTKNDLEERDIKLAELVYGSDKAKELFDELMHQAAVDFGFEVDNMPIMIEATPMASDKLVLNITKVESPDELDLRFSRFTASDKEEMSEGFTGFPGEEDDNTQGYAGNGLADGLKELLKEFKQAKEEGAAKEVHEKTTGDTHVVDETVIRRKPVKIYKATSLDDIIDAAKMVAHIYRGKSSLYKGDDSYYFITEQGKHKSDDFINVSQTIVLYLTPVKYSAGLAAHIREHYKCLIKTDAVKKLAAL